MSYDRWLERPYEDAAARQAAAEEYTGTRAALNDAWDWFEAGGWELTPKDLALSVFETYGHREFDNAVDDWQMGVE